MGRRGPRPLTQQMLRARGSWRAALHANQVVAPAAPPGRPACPAWLDRDAKAAWRHLVRWLGAMKLLTEIDRHALVRYCQTYSRWKKVERFLQKNGETYTPKGLTASQAVPTSWPQVAIAHQLAMTLRALEQEFGMSPRYRMWIQIDPAICRPHEDRERRLLTFFTSGGPAPPPTPRPPSARRSQHAAPRRPRTPTASDSHVSEPEFA